MPDHGPLVDAERCGKGYRYLSDPCRRSDVGIDRRRVMVVADDHAQVAELEDAAKVSGRQGHVRHGERVHIAAWIRAWLRVVLKGGLRDVEPRERIAVGLDDRMA